MATTTVAAARYGSTLTSRPRWIAKRANDYGHAHETTRHCARVESRALGRAPRERWARRESIDALHRGEKIELRGFGSFRLRRREPRKGRNPKTGDKVDVPPKRVPYFKPGKELKDLINRETDAPERAEAAATGTPTPGAPVPQL